MSGHDFGDAPRPSVCGLGCGVDLRGAGLDREEEARVRGGRRHLESHVRRGRPCFCLVCLFQKQMSFCLRFVLFGLCFGSLFGV